MHLPLLFNSPPSRKALHSPLHSWQVHSNLSKYQLRLQKQWPCILLILCAYPWRQLKKRDLAPFKTHHLHHTYKRSTCSSHSSLRSMPGLFGPSSAIIALASASQCQSSLCVGYVGWKLFTMYTTHPRHVCLRRNNWINRFFSSAIFSKHDFQTELFWYLLLGVITQN